VDKTFGTNTAKRVIVNTLSRQTAGSTRALLHPCTRRQLLRGLGAASLGLPLLAGPLLATACTPGTAAPAASLPSGAGIRLRVVVGIIQEPTSLDPTADATNAISVCLRDNVYEGLVRLDGSGKLVGQLAKSWEQAPDGKAVTFHLQDGVKWHDGSPFSAEDVKFSWERAADPKAKPVNPHREYRDPVQVVDIVEPGTVRVRLKAPSDNWLFHMTAGSASIVSSKSVGANATNPVGTGPFRFASWNRGATLALARDDAYWGKKAVLANVDFRFISDAQAMNNGLKAGDLDAIGQVGGPEQLVDFEQDPRFTIVKGAPAGKLMVAVNNTRGPLADKRVRQALYMAIDRRAWIDGIAAGYGVPIGSHASPNDGEPYYADMTSVNPYDPSKAKELLQQAGHTNLTLRLAQIPYPYAIRGTDILTSQLKAIGVSLTVEPMEFARWLQQVFGGAQDYDLTIINHTEERDVANYANAQYYWHYNNPQVADWLKQSDAEPDDSTRKNLYRQIQQQLADDAANLWVYAPNQLQVLKRGLQNLQVQGIAPSLYLGEATFS
jgi:peptide/nickel transport system substrate-binding protein